ncbi:putative feruloyl esterase B-2 [Tolypocladium ophioglossoides CBS 100239]|uniref:Carboxylic ester hydrolase n=1 Tax=Tolypocladium ophioglossoides (strain CBS 100239) TaxID=1163406 RepID=A0A0L0NF66_TOLOC|nr:putative feruloyl esterase B-2 [Tolypocladium ophioglossoides CBS 100239]
MSLAGFNPLSLGGSAHHGYECPDSFRRRCVAFAPAQLLPNATRTHVEYVPGGTTLRLGDNAASCARPAQAVAASLCRVALRVPTSSRSGVALEVWLPEEWPAGRFLATGNGGVDGCIKYEDLAYATANGFAAVGTNNGHDGATGEPFLDNADVLEDFSHRALHTGTVVGKRLAEAFYGRAPAYSYYLGCSLGGRMGIKAAEVHPGDYDGIVAGAPAVDFNHLQGARARFYPITGAAGSPDFIAPGLWTGLIHDEVLRQCDALDGVADGIIEVPGRCHFQPERLLCAPGEDAAGACLTARQVAQLKEIYAPYTYPNGTLIFPRMNPGNEVFAVQKLLAGAPFSYSQDWFRYVVLRDPAWDAASYTSALAALAEQLNPFDIRTFPRALPAFKARGGRLLGYHGGQDNQITSFNTERLWDRLAERDARLRDWGRFFRVSGMAHCGSGPGAWVLGQGGGAAAAGVGFEETGNVLAAVVAWVEAGRAPAALTGTKFVNDTVSLGVDFRRAHCLYPSVQTYIGGDHKLPSSWRCV